MSTSKVLIEVKKKTLVDAYNIVRVQRDLGFPAYQKGEPLHDLFVEIKRSVNKMFALSLSSRAF